MTTELGTVTLVIPNVKHLITGEYDMNTLGGYIATIIVSLIVGYLSRFIEPKSKLLCWSPHNFLFNLKKENVVMQTNSLTVQNWGRKPAEGIEIIHKTKPDFFEIQPSIGFSESLNPNGEHVIHVPTLGAKEWFIVQLLSYKTVPQLQNVRWKDGQGKWIHIAPQRVWPRPLAISLNILTLIGIGNILYWLIRAVHFLNSQIRLF